MARQVSAAESLVPQEEVTTTKTEGEVKGFNFDSVNIDGLTSKSAKMRAYKAAGAETGQIARHMGVKYQFVRNVLVAEKGKLAKAAS